MSETPLFLKLRQTQFIEKNPFQKVFQDYWKEMIQTTLIIIPITTWTYLLYVYIPTYLKDIKQLNFTESFITVIFPLISTFFFLPLADFLSDQWGRRKALTLSLSALTTLTPLIFYLMAHSHHSLIVLCGIFASFMLSLSAAPGNVILVEFFPTKVRNTGAAISYSLISMFGGFTPLILTWLNHSTGNIWGPTCWVSLTGLVGIFTFNFTTSLKTKESLSNAI